MTRAERSLTLGAAACAIAAMLPACGDADSPGVIPTAPVDTTTLVGTWMGTLDGGSAANSLGPSNLTLVLRADSTFTATADNPLYCALTATTWTVARGQVVTTGRDCFGFLLTTTAPVAARRLTGSWSSTSGRSGTFTVAKQ